MNIFQEESVAQEYDAYYNSEQGKVIDALEKEAIVKLMEKLEPSNLLEIGCGTSHWTKVFDELGFQITATDVSDAMLQFARKKQFANVSFQKASVLDLPFNDGQFESIAVITALEFCGNIDQAIAEIKRVLKPGGWLIAGCLNADSTLGKFKNQDPVFKHGHFMTRTELEQQLSKIGEPIIHECVHLSETFELLDHSDEKTNTPGAFMAAAVQKIN